MTANSTVDNIQLFHVFEGYTQHYRLRCCVRLKALSPEAARPRETADRIVHRTEGDRTECGLQRHEIFFLLLSSQYKINYTFCQEALHLYLTSPKAREGDSKNITRYFSATYIWVTSLTGR